MKKSLIKFLALMAVALPMAMLSSCSDDDDDNKKTENQENTIKESELKIDGEEFVKNNWLRYDETGSVIGVAIGETIYEAEPTVAYVGVEDMKDALHHFSSAVMPANAVVKSVNNDHQAVLVDTLGKEQNRLIFTTVDDGKVIAKVKLQKNIGIERYITEIRYIPSSLWPENAIGNNSPFRVGCAYLYKNKCYVCIRSMGYGQDGLLICDLDHKEKLGLIWQWQSEKATANYPNVNTFQEIHKDLSNGVSGQRLWKLFAAATGAAGQPDMRKLKERQYWSSTVGSGKVVLMNLATGGDGQWIEADAGWTWGGFLSFLDVEGTEYWEFCAYKFYKNAKGEVELKKCNNNIWMDDVTDLYPNVSDFVRSEVVEQRAELIEYK